MKVLQRISYVQVYGRIWMPQVEAAYEYPLRDYDIRNMTNDAGTITREDVEDWLTKNAGDFSQVIDFSASIELGEETIDIPWRDEEAELTYNDCVYGD